jgi:hypothetical protein
MRLDFFGGKFTAFVGILKIDQKKNERNIGYET